MTAKMLNWWFGMVLFAAAFILGQVCHRAWGAVYDPFVSRLELLFNVRPGQLIPVDTRAPDVRLQYLWTRSAGNGNYDVRIHRVR